MAHAVSLALVSYGLWLLLSGHYNALLLSLGVVSILVVVMIALRMDVIDREGHPIHLTIKVLPYWAWLGWEIIKSNLDVARRILSPTLPISPTVLRVKASQRSALGKVIYANSITLTPGTVSINIEANEIEVHALTREAAASLRAGEMNRRVAGLEGRD